MTLLIISQLILIVACIKLHYDNYWLRKDLKWTENCLDRVIKIYVSQ